MKIVLTNDDGIDAPGINSLRKVLGQIGEVIVVAPEHGQSGVSHRVTMREPIMVNALDSTRYMVSGTPADCTRIAIKLIAPDADFVFSGINLGANLGTDIYVSGTVAAAREAAFLGKRAVAMSQYIGESKVPDWEMTTRMADSLIDFIVNFELDHGSFLNINLPFQDNQALPLPKLCHPDFTPYNLEYIGTDKGFVLCDVIHHRPRKVGLDIDVCFSGNASVSVLRV